MWWACYMGRGEVVRALLESGADPKVAHNEGTTPVAIAKGDRPFSSISAEGRRECVAALEVRLASCSISIFCSLLCSLSIPDHLLF
jgi:ankyrin repeat protein